MAGRVEPPVARAAPRFIEPAPVRARRARLPRVARLARCSAAARLPGRARLPPGVAAARLPGRPGAERLGGAPALAAGAERAGRAARRPRARAGLALGEGDERREPARHEGEGEEPALAQPAEGARVGAPREVGAPRLARPGARGPHGVVRAAGELAADDALEQRPVPPQGQGREAAPRAGEGRGERAAGAFDAPDVGRRAAAGAPREAGVEGAGERVFGQIFERVLQVDDLAEGRAERAELGARFGRGGARVGARQVGGVPEHERERLGGGAGGVRDVDPLAPLGPLAGELA